MMDLECPICEWHTGKIEVEEIAHTVMTEHLKEHADFTVRSCLAMRVVDREKK